MELIKEEDVKEINKILNNSGKSDVIVKGVDGKIISTRKEEKTSMNVEIRCFSGRIVKHMKSAVINGVGQKTVAVAGDCYDNIRPEDRDLVDWDESDFI